MRALITGIKGFTGPYVADELASAGFEVFGLGTQRANGAHHYSQVDLDDLPRLKDCIATIRPDVVVHLAAVAYVGHGDHEAFYRTNLLGTRNLLDALAAADSSLDCVLLASSGNVYGNQDVDALTEACLPAPANDYAVSKLAMEYMARTWLDRLPIVIARPFNYTGVGQSGQFLLPKIVDHFRSRAPFIELGNLEVWRDFSDVRTVAEIYRRLVQAKPVGQTVNVCSGQVHRLRDVIGMAEDITGHRIEVRVNPAFVRSNEVRTLRGSTDRLRSIIDPWRTIPLDETLRWMLTEGDGTQP